jgi:hypothetical protein
MVDEPSIQAYQFVHDWTSQQNHEEEGFSSNQFRAYASLGEPGVGTLLQAVSGAGLGTRPTSIACVFIIARCALRRSWSFPRDSDARGSVLEFSDRV